MMTIKELYDWAVANGVENFSIKVQFRDDGGDFYGQDDYIYRKVDKENKTITL